MNPNTTTEPTTLFYLYTYPNGKQRVFDCEDDGEHRVLGCVRRVCDKAPLDPNAPYVNEDFPLDFDTAGTEITEEEARNLTGYYLDGVTILNCVLDQLERVKKGDEYEPFIRALWNLVEGVPANRW